MNPVFRGLARELRSHGVKVRKVKGWKERGRSGTWAPRGIMFHHTASSRTSGPAPALGIVTHGRSDLPGPLSNFLVARNGTVFIVAAGRCNHAGFGGPHKGIPRDSGNAFLLGAECENDGRGEEWPREQREAIAILYAVVLRRMKRRARMVIAHKEWAPTRKIDPAGIVMRAFRRWVGKLMRRFRGR